MKIKYVGPKDLVTVTLPVGAGIGMIESRLQFRKGETKEMKEADGKKLLELDGPESIRNEVVGMMKSKDKTGKITLVPEVKEMKNPHPNYMLGETAEPYGHPQPEKKKAGRPPKG